MRREFSCVRGDRLCKNVSYLLRLRYSRYRQTPLQLKRVKAHAIRREPSTLLLLLISIWRISNNKIQRTLQRIFLFFVFAMLP